LVLPLTKRTSYKNWRSLFVWAEHSADWGISCPTWFAQFSRVRRRLSAGVLPVDWRCSWLATFSLVPGPASPRGPRVELWLRRVQVEHRQVAPSQQAELGKP
jgi:hypothetical protein